jgi:hypothetical protein
MTELEKKIQSCKVTGDFGPVWEQFVNTRFFVPITRRDSGAQTADFRFLVLSSPKDGKPVVPISEDLQRLHVFKGSEAIQELGGKLIAMLNPEVGILIALGDDGAFGVPVEILQWLRTSIQLPGSK